MAIVRRCRRVELAAMSDTTPHPGSAVRAAAASAAFSVAIAIALSASSLTSPLLPGLLFVVVLPAVLAGFVAWVLGKLPGLNQASMVAAIAATVVALPWLLVAGAPLARLPWMMYFGIVMVIGLSIELTRRPGKAPLAILAAAILCALPEGKIELGEGDLRPLVVVGMDSANWRFIDEMIAENPQDLPALQELLKRGTFAELQSESPTASARIWTIIATGVNDDLNGIKNFGNRRNELRAGRIWDSVVDGGGEDPPGTAGVVAWLINTPPDPREGLVFNTPGWVTGIREAKPAAANPAKVLESVGEAPANRPGFGELFTAMRSTMAVADADHAWDHIGMASSLVFGKLFSGFSEEDFTWRMKIMRDRINADTYFELARRYGPDFNALVLYGTDQLGHFFWKYHEASHGKRELFPSVSDRDIELRGEAVRDAYRACDEILAKLLEKVDREQVTIMLCSDHGMQPLEESRDDKLLKLKGGVLMAAVGMSDRFSMANLDKALYVAPKSGGDVAVEREMLHDLALELEEAYNVTTGSKLFTLSFPENAKGQMRIDYVQQNKNTTKLDHILRVGDFEAEASKLFAVETRSGRHTLTGFFLMAGPGVRQGLRLEPVSIYDLAPTMAYVMRKRVPKDLPGKVIIGAFEQEFYDTHPLVYGPGGFPDPPGSRGVTDEEKERMKQQLEKSGYMDPDKAKGKSDPDQAKKQPDSDPVKQ
jgi:type I phosphodiesterase/nucleotide pyrophosphatase